MFTRSVAGAAFLAAAAVAQDQILLAPNAIQTGSFFDGKDAFGASDEQAASLTSEENFINFCDGQELTDGLQLIGGSCNGIVMGFIPAKDRMVSTIITNPRAGDVIQSGLDFRIELEIINFQPGTFTNAFATYYSAPQQLNGNGDTIGHTHVTVQDLGGSLNPAAPPDPSQFAFFKGINDEGNGQGSLFADVTGGLPPGNYRVCTLTSNGNHAPVVMPVAQRGSQDDCTKFTVVGNDFDINDSAFNGAGGIEAAQNVEAAAALGPGALEDDVEVEEEEEAEEAEVQEEQDDAAAQFDQGAVNNAQSQLEQLRESLLAQQEQLQAQQADAQAQNADAQEEEAVAEEEADSQEAEVQDEAEVSEESSEETSSEEASAEESSDEASAQDVEIDAGAQSNAQSQLEGLRASLEQQASQLQQGAQRRRGLSKRVFVA